MWRWRAFTPMDFYSAPGFGVFPRKYFLETGKHRQYCWITRNVYFVLLNILY